jgi:hypothetical protein
MNVADIIVSGVGSGSKTFKLRQKRSHNSGTAGWDGPPGRAFISALELTPQVNVVNKNVIGGASSWGGAVVGSYADVKDFDGGTVTSVTITKASATSGILVHGTFGYYGNATTTNYIGVNDGTTDYDLGTEETTSSTRNNVQGERLILAGAATGNYTLKLRFKLGSGGICAPCNPDEAAQSITAIEVEP